jgi:MFS family permease
MAGGVFCFMNPSHPSLAQSLRALPRAAWILFVGTFLNKFGAFVVPFLTLYLTGRGFSLAATGFAVGAYGAGNLLASLLGGYLTDRIGRRNTIVLSMFSSAAAMLLLSQARSVAALFCLTGLAGLTGELYRPASSALLADLVPAGQRVTAFSAYRLAFNAGWAFGPATAGFLASRGYFWLFCGDALTSVAFGVVALTALPHGWRSQQYEAGWGDALRVLRRDYKFQQVLWAALAIGLVFFQMFSSFGLALTRLGLSPATYGAVLSLNGVLVVLFELPLTTITRRFPARRVMAVGYALVALGFGLNWLPHTANGFRVCIAVFTLGEMIAMPVSSAYIADLCPPDMRGRYMGAFGLTWALALTVGPGIGLRLFGLAPGWLWMGGAISGLAAALIILAPTRRRQGDRREKSDCKMAQSYLS